MTRLMLRSLWRLAPAGFAALLAVVPCAIVGCGGPGKRVYRDDYQELPPYTAAPVIETPEPHVNETPVDGEAAPEEQE